MTNKAEGQDYKYLLHGDSVSPTVVYGIHLIPVDLEAGALPPKSPCTPKQIFDALHKDSPPPWMQDFTAFNIAKVASILSSLSGFTFDYTHRLDDFTLVGRPTKSIIPLLTYRPDDKTHSDPTGTAFTEYLLEFSTGVANDGERHFSISEQTKSSLPADLQIHEPRLMIVERWRLASIHEELELGDPAGSVSLTPGETRELTITETRESMTSTKDATTVVEDASDEATQQLNREFLRTTKGSSASNSEFLWSNTSEVTGIRRLHGTGATKLSNSGKEAISTSETVEATLKTIDTIMQKQVRASKLTVSRDYEEKLTTKIERGRNVRLENKSSSSVTYIYYHVNAKHSCHLDLIDVSVAFNGRTVADRAREIRIDSQMRSQVGSLVEEGKAEVALQTIQALLQQRYSSLGIGSTSDGGFVLLDRIVDDANEDLFSRSAFQNQRRRVGALPVNLLTRKVVRQTPFLHMVPHVSQYSVPVPESKQE